MQFSETQQAIRSTIREYLQREVDPLVPEMEAERLLPFGPIRKMIKDLGLGAGGDLQQMIRESAPEEQLKLFVPRVLAIEMARVCAGMGLAHGASLGLFAGNVLSKGTPEQKEKWALPAMRFEKIGCWGLTEPGAGSAAIRDMKSTAVRDGDHWVLNGSKTFITNAPYADLFLVYARVKDETEKGRVEAFLLERGDPGLETGKPFHKMGFKSSPTGEIFLSDCRIPADRLLGGGATKTSVKERLSRERIGLQAISYGIMERAFEIALAYARERKQGGRVIGQYQLIQRRLARMYLALANCRSYVFADFNARTPVEANIADVSVGKLYVAEMSSQVCTDAIHILAGNGYMEEYVVERLYRDAKLIELGGGTTEIQELTAGRWLVESYPL